MQSSNVKRQRVALVLPYNPLLEKSGLQNLAWRWAIVLNRRSFDAVILTLGPSGERDGVRVEGVPNFFHLLRRLWSDDWDVVHWLEMWPSRTKVIGQHLLSLMNRGRVRQVLTTATIGNLPSRGGGRLGKLLYRRAYHSFVVSSPSFVAEYEANGIPAERVHIVPNAMNPDEPLRPLSNENRPLKKQELGLDPDKKTVLYLARMVERKRPLDFIEAAALVLAQRDDVQFVLVGESWHHEDSIDAEVAAAVRANDHRGLALHPQTERPWDYYATADIAVTPSSRDGEAFTILESMACGAVPLVSSLPIFLQMIDGPEPCGRSFPVGEPKALAAEVSALLEDDAERETLRTNAMKKIREERNLETASDGLVAAYAGQPSGIDLHGSVRVE